MTDLQELFTAIDDLSPDDLEQVYRRIIQRRSPAYWLVPGSNLKAIQDIMRPVYEQTASMSDDEIDTAIDEALDEVRRERKSTPHHRN
ncbi:MAG: hypothetical protein LCI00_09130 [Chloroflexi bacterium]|nr:hypothetical protein [Chloroflexota bacterium]MCC6893114.1 hypothetical protein [Anaerolineae bacterium]